MCQLLGLSSNEPADIEFSLMEFKYRAKYNYHGWGFGFLDGNNWKIIKQPSSLDDENINEEKFKFKSKIIIGHVRLKSCGDKIHQNTHPFQIENWVFAHNGTVSRIKNWPLEKYKPEGDTDSEYAFCHLLEKITLDASEVNKIIKKEADKIRALGKFNFLMSDGKRLYAYGDNSLYYVQRESPFGFATLKDVQYKINLAEVKKPGEVVTIIATEPLTSDEKWIRIEGLKIFENGIIKE
ncbi:MAG: class II glutamine amidotransferase [Candidatus Methanofastidiosum sp.]|nr:class II glutamine amidotransferase [Methanofastidiosum sp.]